MSKDHIIYRLLRQRVLTEIVLYRQHYLERGQGPERSLRNIMGYAGRYRPVNHVNREQLIWALERAKSELGFDKMSDKTWAYIVVLATSSFFKPTNPRTQCTWEQYLAVFASKTRHISTNEEIRRGVTGWGMKCDCD